MGPRQDDGQLVEEARQGSRSAFDALLDRYWHGAVAVARRHSRSIGDAEDAVQEAFIRAHARLGQLQNPTKFGGWLFSIVVRQAIDETRRRRPLSVEDPEVFGSPEIQPEAVVPESERSAVREEIHAAIGDLPARYRAVVVLRYGQGLSVKEIGRTLDLPIGTVVSQMFRANRILRTRLRHLVSTTS